MVAALLAARTAMSGFANSGRDAPMSNSVPLTFWPLFAALWQPPQLVPL
jgi:hypothetical protein